MSGGNVSMGLEVWLVGTPAEIDTAARALADVGRVAYSGERVALTGRDAGRSRVYARLQMRTAGRSVDEHAASLPAGLDLNLAA